MDVLSLIVAGVAALAAVASAVLAWKAFQGSIRTEATATEANEIATAANQIAVSSKDEISRLASAAERSADHQGTAVEFERDKLTAHIAFRKPSVGQDARGKYLTVALNNEGPSPARDVRLVVLRDGQPIPVRPEVRNELDGSGPRTDCSFSFNVDQPNSSIPDPTKLYEVYVSFRDGRQVFDRTASRYFRFRIGTESNPGGDWVVEEEFTAAQA